MSKKQEVLNASPAIIKNIMITLYNLRLRKWHTKEYFELKEEYKNIFQKDSLEEIRKKQNERFMTFLGYIKKNNEYYRELLKNIEVKSIDDLHKIPYLKKEHLRKKEIVSNTNEKLITSFTGGTTGKSFKISFIQSDFAERQANLDFFRGQFGYSFGDKTAWFSGKEIVGDKDVKNNLFWVKDYINKITYYSTLHMQEEYAGYIVEELNKSKPLYFVGFPSAFYSLTYLIKKLNLKIDFHLKAIFPTSEPLLDYQKELMKEVFDCPIVDQYASSEGAPFIYECLAGSLHYDMYSGVFENKSEESNQMLVTSFTTHSMPLVRYDIGDSVEFDDSNRKCSCGSNMPLVKSIEGRSMSFLYSKERGIVGLGNVSNIVKYANEIEKLQVIQNNKDSIEVFVVSDVEKLQSTKAILEKELRYRLGDKMKITFEFVEHIPNEKSGKFLMIKSTLNLEDCLNNA